MRGEVNSDCSVPRTSFEERLFIGKFILPPKYWNNSFEIRTFQWITKKNPSITVLLLKIQVLKTADIFEKYLGDPG